MEILMSTKAELIQDLLQMQRDFIKFEHENGMHPDDYYNPGAGHPLETYKNDFMNKAVEVLDMAHDEKDSAWKR